jgi:hypothetical protein
LDQALANISRQQVAATVFASDEYVRDLVELEFDHLLHRDAEPQVLASFAGELEHGGRDEQVIAQIIGSQEYFERLV